MIDLLRAKNAAVEWIAKVIQKKVPTHKILVVVNRTLNEDDPVLSHQISVVNHLSLLFEKVIVLTGSVGSVSLNSNVTVVSCDWKQGKNLRNSVNFFRRALPFLRGRHYVFFFHMTDVQSALLAPITFLFRIRHVLWYAHKKVSIYLRITSVFKRTILSASSGSCSLPKDKFLVIGHGVETDVFCLRNSMNFPLKRCISLGRLDPSKGIHLMIETFLAASINGGGLEIHFFGESSNGQSRNYIEKLKLKYSEATNAGLIYFNKPVKRSEISVLLANYDIFLHAYEGSLDKSVLEATLVGIPVVTLNKEYLSIFGKWNKESSGTLFEELMAVLKMDLASITNEVTRRANLCKLNFGMDRWVKEISRILVD